MRHTAAALVLSLLASAAFAQDGEPKPKEMESQSQIADRIVAEQQGLKIQEVNGVMSAPVRAFAPIEGGGVEAPGGPGGDAAHADAQSAEAAAAAKKAKESGGIPWGIVAGVAVSLVAAVIFVRAWRNAADAS